MPKRFLVPRFIFLAAAGLLLAVGAGVVFSAARFIQDSRWVLESTMILRELDDVATLEQRAVSSQRGYLLTSDEGLRNEFWEVRSNVLRESAALRSGVVDQKSAPLARELEGLLQRRMDLAAKALTLFERQGLEAARSFISNNGSLELDKRIRSHLETIRARQLQLLSDRRAALDWSARLVMFASALGIPISLGMLAMVNRALVAENLARQRGEREATAVAQGYKRLSTDMESLTRFAGMLQSCEDSAELLAITARSFATFAPGLACTVYLLRRSRDHAEAVASWGIHSAGSEPHPAPSECWAVRRDRPFVCEDVQTGISCPHVSKPEGDATASTACIPLSAQGELMGWLYLSRPGSGPMPEYDVVLQAAEQMSLALANMRLQEELRHQSIRDPLTGLYNRRYLEESLAREISRCTRRNLPLVVLMLDIDHFKAFNDVHGHPGGDAVLAEFGRLLQSSCRAEDIPCRFGGEEFTVILPESDLETGLQRARAIVQDTAKMVVNVQGVALGRVTASIGVSALPRHGLTATALIEAGDRALYQAKAKGRNQACVVEDRIGDAIN